MRDDEPFLRAITDSPDDDLPRLVYADYLDERGDHDRAEFIRVQCELARHDGDYPRRRALWVRQWDLLGEYREQWAEPVRPWVQSFQYRRGFLESVSLGAWAFVCHAEALGRQAPIRHVHLDDAWEEIDKVAAVPGLGRLRSLSLSGNLLRDDDVSQLLQSPYLARLEHLDLERNRLFARAVELLAESPGLAGLRSLKLGANSMGDAAARALALSPRLERLTELDLSWTNTGPLGVVALANENGLPALTALDLRGNQIGYRGVQALLFGPNPMRWTRLALSRQDLSAGQQAELERRFGSEVLYLER
jgi:uncharacterized protein (TIGR02996 family)